MLKSGFCSIAQVVLAFSLLTACGEPERVVAPQGAQELIETTEETSSPKYVQCPVNVTKSVTGVIDGLGGSLSLDGTVIVIPEGAVLEPTSFRLTLPASRYMEVRITAKGHEGFDFLVPAVVAVDYSRCSRTDILHTPLTVWYVDTHTKAPLENMGGIDDKLLRTVTFTTGHLSTYVVAE